MASRYIVVFLLLFTVNYSRAQVTAQESILSNVSNEYIKKLIDSAKAHYPKVKAFESKTNIARINVHKAKLDWFNILSFNYIYTPATTATVATTTGATFNTGYQIGVGTSIGNILMKPSQVRAAKEEYDIALLDMEEYNLNLETAVKQKYYSYLQQLAILNWRTKSMESADRIARENKYKYEKGEETFEKYNSTYSSYSSAVQSKIEAETAYLIAKSNLEEIIGVKLEAIK